MITDFCNLKLYGKLIAINPKGLHNELRTIFSTDDRKGASFKMINMYQLLSDEQRIKRLNAEAERQKQGITQTETERRYEREKEAESRKRMLELEVKLADLQLARSVWK